MYNVRYGDVVGSDIDASVVAVVAVAGGTKRAIQGLPNRTTTPPTTKHQTKTHIHKGKEWNTAHRGSRRLIVCVRVCVYVRVGRKRAAVATEQSRAEALRPGQTERGREGVRECVCVGRRETERGRGCSEVANTAGLLNGQSELIDELVPSVVFVLRIVE